MKEAGGGIAGKAQKERFLRVNHNPSGNNGI